MEGRRKYKCLSIWQLWQKENPLGAWKNSEKASIIVHFMWKTFKNGNATEERFRIQEFGQRWKVVLSHHKTEDSLATYHPPECGPIAEGSLVLVPSQCWQQLSQNRESTSLSLQSDSGNSLLGCSLCAAPGVCHVPWQHSEWNNPLWFHFPHPQGAETRLPTGC